MITRVLVRYEASRTWTRRLTSAPDGVHGKVTEEAVARSPPSATVVQSRTSVSVPSALICTARTCCVPAMPPATVAVTSTDAPTSPVYV